MDRNGETERARRKQRKEEEKEREKDKTIWEKEIEIQVFFFLVGWDWVSWYYGHYWPIVPALDVMWWWLWRNWWNEDWQGKPKYSEKTCTSATLSTTNPTWPDLGSKPGRRGGNSVTNRLSYGTALKFDAFYSVRGSTFRRNVLRPEEESRASCTVLCSETSVNFWQKLYST
jgi:hypothetical protein